MGGSGLPARGVPLLCKGGSASLAPPFVEEQERHRRSGLTKVAFRLLAVLTAGALDSVPAGALCPQECLVRGIEERLRVIGALRS